MDIRVIAYVLFRLVLAEAAILLVPFFMALAYGEIQAGRSFFVSMLISALLGDLLYHVGKVRPEQLTMREGIAITGFGWLLATGMGMLPYVCGNYLGPLDALFESISGFTGTGATVFPTLEYLPQSLLFFRMMTHWFGGLGIIVIFIALLPQTGQSAIYMYNAESTGPTRDRMMPRLRDMTKALFKIYMLFTGIATVVYMLCGLGPLEALNHAMSTIGTGGFSTHDDNMMHFDNVPLEASMTFFMILAGGNFALYYRIWHKGFGVVRRNTEFKVYLAIEIVATILVTANLIVQMQMPLGEALRYASFQVGSLSTTGFVSADFDQWPAFSKGILMLIMISGGCAGSTAGGMKVSRVVILCKHAWAVVHQKLSPRRVIEVRLNGSKVELNTLTRVGQFFFLYMFFIVFFTLLLTFDGISVFDAIGISVTTMGSVGPAFGIAGATCTYAGLSDFVKSVLCVSMLLGRLEMFTLLIMLRPEFWHRRTNW